MFSRSRNSCILVRAMAGAPAESPVKSCTGRPASMLLRSLKSGEHVVTLLEIEREALLHLDAAGGERAGFHGEEADLHRSALSAQDRGRGDERARCEHALQDGAATDGHCSSLRLRLMARGFSHRLFLIKLDIILTYRDQSCPAGRTPAAARRRLISYKDCDVFYGISGRSADDAIRFPGTWI